MSVSYAQYKLCENNSWLSGMCTYGTITRLLLLFLLGTCNIYTHTCDIDTVYIFNHPVPTSTCDSYHVASHCHGDDMSSDLLRRLVTFMGSSCRFAHL